MKENTKARFIWVGDDINRWKQFLTTLMLFKRLVAVLFLNPEEVSHNNGRNDDHSIYNDSSNVEDVMKI